MIAEIRKGDQLMLDGKTIVTVIRPVNRSETLFSVEVAGQGIIIVEKDRLTRPVASV